MPGTWAAELLPAFAVYEVVLSALLLTNRFTYVASLLAAATLLGIVVANPDAFEVLFRNVAIACAALALALQDRQQRIRPDPPPPHYGPARAATRNGVAVPSVSWLRPSTRSPSSG